MDDSDSLPDPALAHRARALHDLRRRRDAALPHAAALFGEAAWDILLHLYAAPVEGLRVTVSCACAAAAVPVSTAHRQLRALEQAGLVRRVADATDGRRNFMSLTLAGQQAMTRLLREACVV